jgi:hypothetical protein
MTITTTFVTVLRRFKYLAEKVMYSNHYTVQRKFLIYLHFKVFGAFPLVGTHNHILREQFNFLSLANRRKIILFHPKR